MKEVYSTKMINKGARGGISVSEDNSLELKMAAPGSNIGGTTNPEQLFAAGYSACFNSALGLVLKQEGIAAESTISATVKLYKGEEAEYGLGVVIEGHIDGIEIEKTKELLDKAHEVCPYSKATKGNIEVLIKAV